MGLYFGTGLRALWSQLFWRAAGVIAPRRAVSSRGLHFSLQADNWITGSRWSSYNTKEPETLDWIDRQMQDGDILFDVGANIGVYALYAALRHPKARVAAFEPEYANLHLLRDNVIKNRLQDRIEVYAMALSDHTGVSWLHVQDLTPGSALHTEAEERLQVTRMQQPIVYREGISAITLDEFCRQTRLQPHGIKIDVDGTEAEILEGAVETLRCPALRSLIIEMPSDSSSRVRCERVLLAAGFQSQGPAIERGRPTNQVWLRAARAVAHDVQQMSAR